MEIIDGNERTGRKPRILVLGSTGRTGKAVIAELEQRSGSLQVVYSSRNAGRSRPGAEKVKTPSISIWMMLGPFRMLWLESTASSTALCKTRAYVLNPERIL